MRIAFRTLAVALGVLVMLPYCLAPLYRFGHPVSTPMLWRWLIGARVDRVWIPIEDISPALPLGVVVAEDARFCEHGGVDWEGMEEAIGEEDARVRGGSGITQQLAKNLFLWQARSYVRKALELPLALWVDLVLGKRRVLELYLNLAKWGPNGEFGAEAGARRAFHRSARALSLREATLLAAALPNPGRRDAARPRPILLRLSALYEARARASPQLDACIYR